MHAPAEITIVSGTNRPESYTRTVANHIYVHLKSRNIEVNFIDLAALNPAMLSPEMYSHDGQHPEVSNIQDRFFEPQKKFIFVAPEYNGSIPGVLKVFLDALSVRKYRETFFHKKACLIGVASGRAGNLRGLDHLSDILTYLGVIIFPAKLPVSRVLDYISENRLNDQEVAYTIEKLVDDFLKF